MTINRIITTLFQIILVSGTLAFIIPMLKDIKKNGL